MRDEAGAGRSSQRSNSLFAANSEEEVADGLPLPQRYWALLVLTAGVFLAVIDTIGINVALPVMAQEFGVDNSAAVWVVTAYQLAVTISLFPLAALGDRFGYHRIYLIGVAVFVVFSLVCAGVSNLDEIIAARVFQGLGGSAIMAMNLPLVRFIVPRHFLGRGIAYMTLVVALSGTSGPIISGSLLAVADWRALFFLNVPVGIVILVIGRMALPHPRSVNRHFDVAGAAFLAVTIGAVVMTIDAFGRDLSTRLLGLAVAFDVALAWFLLRHQRLSPAPVLPLDLLDLPIIRLSTIIAISAFVTQGLCYVSLPFYLHDVAGLSPEFIGLSMAPWPAGIIVASLIVGRLIGKVSAGVFGVIGLSVLVAGICFIVPAVIMVSTYLLVAGMFVCGIGFGLFQSTNSFAIMSGAPMERSGGASGIHSSGRLFGQTIGAASVAAIFGLAPEAGVSASAILALGFAVLALIAAFRRNAFMSRDTTGT